jgi:molecular chaperone DnaK
VFGEQVSRICKIKLNQTDLVYVSNPFGLVSERGIVMTYQVGVDLGATFTAAAACRSGRAEVIPFSPRAAFLSSVAYVHPDGSLVLGESAEQRALSEPDRVARQFTRRVGDGTPLRLGGVSMTADALAARFVAHVVGTVAGMVGGPGAPPPLRVALTHPAGWGPHRLASLHAALTAQGLGGTVLLSGAQAAARAYAERVPLSAGDLVAVYDLGGSGFDAAVVRKLDNGPGGRYVLAGQAEELELGGLDFDELVFDHVRRALGERWDAMDPADPALRPALARLRRECVVAKEALSADTDVRIPVALPGIDTTVRLARAEFEEMIRPAIEETAATLYRAIDTAGSAPEDVAAVLLTGGSARLPLVTQVVSEVLGRPVVVAPNPKADTAIGAALAIGGQDTDTPAVGLAAGPMMPPAQPEPEPTRIALRALPAPAPTPVRPPLPVSLAAPDKPAHKFGMSRTLATAAAAVTALAVGGGILLASHNGPPGADADTRENGSTSSTGQTVTSTPESTTKKKPASTSRQTAEPPATGTEEPQPEPQTPNEEPEESTATPREPEATTLPPDPTTTTATSTETVEDPPAKPADPDQAERPQS